MHEVRILLSNVLMIIGQTIECIKQNLAILKTDNLLLLITGNTFYSLFWNDLNKC